jgi:hypothetical protein
MEGQGLPDQQDALCLCGSLRESFEKSFLTEAQRRGGQNVEFCTLDFEFGSATQMISSQ